MELNPNAIVAVDVVVFTLRPAAAVENQWQVLLVRRDEPAFGDKLSLAPSATPAETPAAASSPSPTSPWCAPTTCS